MSVDLLVNEIFGPVWQGEGRQAGQRCFFIRTSTCNLTCSWCDTPQTWVFTERKVAKHDRALVPYDVRQEAQRYTPGTILLQLQSLGASRDDLIVISGGEPLLQQIALQDVFRVLLDHFDRFAFETAGTIVPDLTLPAGKEYTWVVSPKLASSGNKLERRYNAAALWIFNEMKADFKFVISSESDYPEVDELVDEHEIDHHRVWVMPEGITAGKIIEGAQAIAPWAGERGYNLTLRQHVLLFGDERKR